ncbi:MAG: hypothetical protein C5B43_05040 [Verrucomicrobia bacterium]|nr:MAG: hypothetical protein C5B43_05040 [Verrucomicrobiota bacterium]
MKIVDNIMCSIKHFFHPEEKKEHTKAEEMRDLIKKNIAEEDRHLFKHFCHEDLRKLLELKEGHELREQSVEDILGHMDRALTKTAVTDHEKEFCADVILKMFKATDDRGALFDRIEAFIGSEHFLTDLVKHNRELESIINNLKS